MYELKVVIVDPALDNAEKITLEFECRFNKVEGQYGNKTYLKVKGVNGTMFDRLYDIRYDTEYRSDEQEKYLVKWANRYWSGKNGAFKLVDISIEEVE